MEFFYKTRSYFCHCCKEICYSSMIDLDKLTEHFFLVFKLMLKLYKKDVLK